MEFMPRHECLLEIAMTMLYTHKLLFNLQSPFRPRFVLTPPNKQWGCYPHLQTEMGLRHREGK